MDNSRFTFTWMGPDNKMQWECVEGKDAARELATRIKEGIVYTRDNMFWFEMNEKGEFSFYKYEDALMGAKVNHKKKSFYGQGI